MSQLNPTSESDPSSGTEIPCPSCQKLFVPVAGQEVCGDCASYRTMLWVIGIGLLFFCFVALPMLIQLLGTPRPE